MIRLEAKRSDETRRYRHDWTPFLGEDTIVPPVPPEAAEDMFEAEGVTIDSAGVEDGDRSVKFTVSGGEDGVPGVIKHTITTAAGDTETETFIIAVVDEELVTVAEAKTYMRILGDSFDAEIALKLPQAQSIVIDYIERPDHGWTALTVPDLIRAAIYEVAKGMMGDGDGEPLGATVKNLLRRYRDPALA